MKINVVMMVIYGVVGMAAAFAPHGLLDPKLSFVAVFLMYSAHISWGAVAAKHAHDRSGKM